MTAVVTALIVAAAFAVASLHMRRQKLSPALRAEYEELGRWAESQTAIINDAYRRAGWNTGRAATDGDRSRRMEMSATTLDPRLRRLGWDEDGPPCVTLANLILRARRAEIATLDDPLFDGDEAGEIGYCAARIGRLLDRAEELGRLDDLAREPRRPADDEVRQWLVRC